ncbi:MAG: hypothetical protein AMXMBFR64_43910 [Myxococcales bacterium]
MNAVWVLDTGLPDDPITDRPSATLDEQCRQAALRILERRPALRRQVDGLYFGSMGIFAGDTRGRRVPSHIPRFLREELGLTALREGGLYGYASTSESGGVALLRAFRDVARGHTRTALVVAGEQMFSVDRASRPEDRRGVAAWIRGVLDPREAHPYGLSMLAIGDLLMDHLAWGSGLPASDWRAVLETVALDKYRRAALHSHTMHGAKERARGAVVDLATYRDERANPWASPWFRRDDVCASANGATALLLTSDPGLLPAEGPRARIAAMGEGSAAVHFAGRPGPLRRFGAIRASLRQLLRSGPGLGLLRDPALSAALLHDAFPSIELAFLTELAPRHSWRWALERLIGGWTNPLGGLCGGGHALGNSGLFQAAKAAQLLLDDRRHLLPGAPESAAIYLLTNVGSALTSVVSTVLCDDSRPEVVEALRRPATRLAFAPATSGPPLGVAATALDPDELIVAARTKVTLEGEPRWVLLGAGTAGTRFVLHAPQEAPAIGTVVRVVPRGDRVVVAAVERPVLSAPIMAREDVEAVRTAVATVRSGRLAPRIGA